MSLDINLRLNTPISKKRTGVFVRENGTTRELTIGEVREKFPDAVAVEYEYESEYVFKTNITHNLGKMASKANIYKALWRPYQLKKSFSDFNFKDDYEKEMEFETSQEILASEIIPYLEKGLKKLKTNPNYFKKFNAANGWGTYEQFVPFVEEYLKACKKYPDSIIDVNR